MKLISELKDLNKDTIKGSHITIHLAMKFVGMDESQINKQNFYNDYAKGIPEAKCRFGISAFPGAKDKLEKKLSKPIRYDGEWITNILTLFKN
jgi:hypothetical protein